MQTLCTPGAVGCARAGAQQTRFCHPFPIRCAACRHPFVRCWPIYGLAALFEIGGIVLTVNTYIEFENGLGEVHQPETRRQAVRGTVLIGIGVLVGRGGNVASLFV